MSVKLLSIFLLNVMKDNLSLVISFTIFLSDNATFKKLLNSSETSVSSP
jgi:hypothetical protein